MEFSLLKQVKSIEQLCPVHNVQLVQLNEKKPFCTKCQREKLDKENDKMAFEITKQALMRRTFEALEKDSIVGDPTLWKASFDNYVPDNLETHHAFKQAQIIAGEYLDKEKNFNTLFTGVPGVGKSHLAMSILKEVNKNFTPFGSCLFVSVSDLMRLVKDSISNQQSRYTENNMIRLLTEVDLLVLDDFGSESSLKRASMESSEYNQRLLFNILNGRSRTIITTNLSKAEMDQIYNTKITSRLHRGINGHIIKFTQATVDKRSNFDY